MFFLLYPFILVFGARFLHVDMESTGVVHRYEIRYGRSRYRWGSYSAAVLAGFILVVSPLLIGILWAWLAYPSNYGSELLKNAGMYGPNYYDQIRSMLYHKLFYLSPKMYLAFAIGVFGLYSGLSAGLIHALSLAGIRNKLVLILILNGYQFLFPFGFRLISGSPYLEPISEYLSIMQGGQLNVWYLPINFLLLAAGGLILIGASTRRAKHDH